MDGKVVGNTQRCPEARWTASMVDKCNLNGKPCILETYGSCPIYEDWLFEERQEELDHKKGGEEDFNDLFDRGLYLAEKT